MGSQKKKYFDCKYQRDSERYLRWKICHILTIQCRKIIVFFLEFKAL